MKFEGSTRFNVGDTVWSMNNNKPQEFKVTYIDILPYTVTGNGYDDCGYYPSYRYTLTPLSTYRYEYEIAATKEELMKNVFDLL